MKSVSLWKVFATLCSLNAFAIALPSSSIYAQSITSSKVWTLEECMDYAYKNNISILQSNNAVKTANINKWQSQANLLPQINASGSQNYSAGGRSIDPFTNQIVVDQTFRSNNISLGGSWNLFSGFQTVSNIRQANASQKAAELDVETARNNLNLNIITAYIDILNNKEQVRVAEEQIALTKLQVDRTDRLVKAGASAMVNLLNLQSQLASDELNLVTFQNTLDIAKLRLQQLMQKPLEENFEIESPAIPELLSPISPNKAAEVYAVAEKQLPQVKASEQRVAASMRALDAAKGALLPSISMNAGYFTNYSSLARNAVVSGVEERQSQFFFRDASGNITQISQVSPIVSFEDLSFSSQFNNNLRRSLGFSINIPIFSNFQTQAGIARSKIQLNNAALEVQNSKNNLRQEVEQAIVNAKAAAKRYNSVLKQVESLREALRANEQRLNVGAINSVDYNLAKANLTRAESDLVRAKYEYLLRTKLIDFYEGKPLKL